jgi:type II secretory pathway pseudopilin PulG
MLVVVVMVCLLAVVGCAAIQNWLCSNRTTLENDITVAQAAIAAVQQEYGSNIPPAGQAIIAAANAAITAANTALANENCPTTAQVQNVTNLMRTMNDAVAKMPQVKSRMNDILAKK